MRHWAESYKPAATVTTQLMLAWLMWAVVGAGLVGFGASWLLGSLSRSTALWLAAGAVLVGIAKSRLVLDRAAHRLAARIAARGDGRCLGGFLSLPTWGLVVVMMVAGRLLRAVVADWVVGALYVAVGSALCLSSRHTWRAWRASRRSP